MIQSVWYCSLSDQLYGGTGAVAAKAVIEIESAGE